MDKLINLKRDLKFYNGVYWLFCSLGGREITHNVAFYTCMGYSLRGVLSEWYFLLTGGYFMRGILSSGVRGINTGHSKDAG
jgi:hypothetical protein